MIATEHVYYASKRNKYGIPLDNRATFTKGDWLSWVAAMGSDQQFADIFHDLFTFLQETPSRVPFTDWYDTVTGAMTGFVARPVVGGMYAKMVLSA